MTNDDGRKPEGAPERSPKAGVGGSGGDGNGPKRFSVQRKMAIVARLLRGEPLDLVARQTNVSVAKLTAWRLLNFFVMQSAVCGHLDRTVRARVASSLRGSDFAAIAYSAVAELQHKTPHPRRQREHCRAEVGLVRDNGERRG